MDNVRIIYDLSTLRAVQVIEIDSVTTTDFNSNYYGVLQGPSSLVEQQCEQLGVTNVDFENTTVLTSLTDRDRVIMDRHFGQEILNEFLALNKALPLTPEQDLAQLEMFAPIKAMLEVGGIRTAKVLLEEALTDEFFTQQVKDHFLSKMTNYLAS